MKATEQYFSVVLFIFMYMVVIDSLEPVDGIQKPVAIYMKNY